MFAISDYKTPLSIIKPIKLAKPTTYKKISNLELVKICAFSQEEHFWDEFHKRFSKYIKLYIRKAWKNRSPKANVDSPNTKETLKDLAQEVYIKILEFDRQALRKFQGENDVSFLAYLAKISSNVVSEHFRRQSAEKRRGLEMSMETLLDEEVCELLGTRSLSSDYLSIDGEKLCLTLLESQQISKLMEDSLAGLNSKRDLLVFKLFVVEGLTSKQIIESENLDIKSSSIESIVRRVKDKIRHTLKINKAEKDPFKQAA